LEGGNQESNEDLSNITIMKMKDLVGITVAGLDQIWQEQALE